MASLEECGLQRTEQERQGQGLLLLFPTSQGPAVIQMTIIVLPVHKNDCWPGASSSTETIHRHFCKLKCFTSCSYCTQDFAKERSKSQVSSLLFFSKQVQSKICERRFLCHLIVLCQLCNKCQNCCTKSACRGQTSKLLANLVGS